jgi:hypothetical protein
MKKKYLKPTMKDFKILLSEVISKTDLRTVYIYLQKEFEKLSAGEKIVPSRTLSGMPALASRDNNYERKQ